MPTNEQRRATAKRKLERQLERRAKQARRRRILVIVGGSIAALVVVAAVVATVILTNQEHKSKQTFGERQARSTSAAPGTSSGTRSLPSFKPAADLGANCQYPPSPDTGQQAGQAAQAPARCRPIRPRSASAW